MLGNALQKIEKQKIPAGVGKFTTDLDRALLGVHVRQIYDNLKHLEASILAQLQTGMARSFTELGHQRRINALVARRKALNISYFDVRNGTSKGAFCFRQGAQEEGACLTF